MTIICTATPSQMMTLSREMGKGHLDLSFLKTLGAVFSGKASNGRWRWCSSIRGPGLGGCSSLCGGFLVIVEAVVMVKAARLMEVKMKTKCVSNHQAGPPHWIFPRNIPEGWGSKDHASAEADSGYRDQVQGFCHYWGLLWTCWSWC